MLNSLCNYYLRDKTKDKQGVSLDLVVSRRAQSDIFLVDKMAVQILQGYHRYLKHFFHSYFCTH